MRQLFDLSPENVETGWENYPRPQFRRDSFYSLNGIWKVSGQDVVVPFALQSKKSGYTGKVPKEFIYEKHFQLPKGFVKDKVLLHFGAVDQEAVVYINDKLAGSHQGGYLPFELDITRLIETDKENAIRVEVRDTLSHLYPYGKQKKRRGGMWYTPVSGIWQTVWLESVEHVHIRKIKMTPDLKGILLNVDTNAPKVQVTISLGGYHYEQIYDSRKKDIRIDVENPVWWTCDNPALYNMTIKTVQRGEKVGTAPVTLTGAETQNMPRTSEDVVYTYFALRTVTIEAHQGVSRICLNHKPIFLNGVLDQGYFCDGIFTPSNEEEYEKDILRMKKLGFNTLRKHIKIEPECFYYDCDRLGMLVLQDMVNNGHYSFFWDTVMPTFCSKRAKDTRRIRSIRRKRVFVEHMKETLRHLYNHPCIIGYTIFNEGWGQFDSDRIYDVVKKLDSSRFLDMTSGWFKQKKSDVDSEHVYFKNILLHPEKSRPMLLSECGGFSYTVKNHIFSSRVYGYGPCGNEKELWKKILEMYEDMVIPAIPKGLCGCIYTQLSDVEDEVNGIYTYDRLVCKVDEKEMCGLNHRMTIL